MAPKPKRPRANSVANDVMTTSGVVNISSIVGPPSISTLTEEVKKLVGAVTCPRLYKHVAIRYPDQEDAQPTFPLNTTYKIQPDFPQGSPAFYPSGHPLAGLAVSDLSGSPNILTGNLFDEMTLALGLEYKNITGNFCTYRAMSPLGTSDFKISCGVTAVSTTTQQTPATTAPTHPLDAAVMIFDNSVATNALAGTTPLVCPAMASVSYQAYHGQQAAVGRSVRTGHTYVPTSGNPLATLVNGSVECVTSIDSARNALNSAKILSSCYIFEAGTGGLATGDQINITLYGFNEATEEEYGNVSFQVGTAIPAGGFVAAIPQPLFDWCRPEVTITVAGSVTPASAKNVFRNLRWGVCHTGGIYAQSMAPAINSVYTLANFTSTRLIANEMDAENWTSEFSIGSKAGVVQPPTGTYFQAQGFDQANLSPTAGTNTYFTMINKPDEDDDVAKYGNHCYLSPAGSRKTDWRDNIDVPSSAFNGTNIVVGTIGVYHDLENKNYNQFAYVSPGITSTQTAQQLQLTNTVIGEAKTEQLWLQTEQATDDLQSWTDMFKLVGSMKHSSRRPDPAYYWSTLDWKRAKAKQMMEAGPRVVW